MKTNTDELQVFVSVIDCGSITAAAETLQQTVSGVSRAFTRLEKKLDATLVRRTTRRLQLTDEGELFLARARRSSPRWTTPRNRSPGIASGRRGGCASMPRRRSCSIASCRM